jgi:hypothetical protein
MNYRKKAKEEVARCVDKMFDIGTSYSKTFAGIEFTLVPVFKGNEYPEGIELHYRDSSGKLREFEAAKMWYTCYEIEMKQSKSMEEESNE